MMTAVDPLSSTWIPEDDLLLKNAVEAGASLEALAKGAVPFSRRFTYRELRDRWHSLLFDPDVSAQASDSMLKLERSGSNPSSKFNRLEHSKGNGKVLEKRKIGSIRREYYAMRKKIRSELFNASDLEFFGEPSLIDCGEHGGDFQGHLALDNEPHDGNHILSDCISNDLGLQETDFEILRHAFPETMMDISPTTAVDNNGNAFNTECQNPVEDNHPNRSLYQFPEDVSPLLINDGRESYEPNIEHKSASHMLEDNSSNFGGEEIGTSQALPTQKMFETDDSQAKPLSAFGPVDDNHQNLCSGFGGKQHFNSPDSDSCTSFHSLGFSSPLPRMPLWKTMEDLSAPAMPVSVNNEDRIQCEEENLALPDKGDGNRKSPPGYDVVHSGSPLTDRDNGAGFINSTAISDAEFADLSDSLLNFSNEEELLLMDIDGKDAMAKSCYENLNSLLLSSPNDVHDGDLCNVEPRTSNVSKVSIATPSGPCLTDSEDIGSTVHGEQQSVCHSEVNVPSVSVLNSHSLEISDGTIFCTLNTEDQEIPCNDDIFLLIHPATSFAASASQPVTMDSIEQLSSSADEKDCEQRLNLMKKGKEPAQSFKWSQMVGPSMLPESVPGQSIIGGAVKSEFADTKCLSRLPGEAKKALRDPTQCRSLIATADGFLEEDVTKVEFRVLDTPATSREMPSRLESGSTKMGLLESMVKPSTSDQDEPESDNEVPYYSDIEAMILEMDLGQYDQESDVSRQVARYQHGDSMRRIIRLEQCARSSLQRAMAFHGAIAMLYGRHLKHYIRKREVVLGRSTDDIDVDIDLRKEGRANKISRRQATIKMEEDGSFFLKNLGKNSISVNGKAVATGQLLKLSPSCLIEIRGMSFGFEINDKYMSRRVDNSTEKRQGKKSKFEWLPEGEP